MSGIFERKPNQCTFLQGGGEMGQRIREYDWTSSSLGDADRWPQSLRTTLNLIINNKFPMFLWWGPDLICFYNDAYRPSLGNSGKHPAILGMTAIEAWPEIWDYIGPLIKQVMQGGDSVYMEDLFLPIYRNGKIEDVYWTFGYSPVIDETNCRVGVLVTCNETTQKIDLFNDLQESERRFQNLIRNAKVGMVVLSGEECKVEVVNEAYGKLIGRTPEELLGRPLFTIIPETAAEFQPIVEKVRTFGEPVILHEKGYRVYKEGNEISGYLDLVYQPFKEADGAISGVMVLCQDVTEQVNAKLAIQTTLDQLRLSKDAAQLGMFDMDLRDGHLEWDERCRNLFGISHTGPVTYEHDFVNGLHPDDRQRITSIIAALFRQVPASGDYDVEYRTIGAEDGKIRWVRAKGKAYFDTDQKPVRFIGSVLDISDQKIAEARKNDFIAMVSHELKTPLTSLTGYIQLLTREAEGQNDEFQRNVLFRANIQTKKMNSLINGFLNVSRFESGKLHLQPQTFSLAHLISDAIGGLAIGIDDKRLQFVPEGEMMVYADREKIESVITNLLSNALKYSDLPVTIECKRADNDWVVSVADGGIGITPEDMRFIFDRFYRVDSKHTKDIAGFGIGLYISSEMIKMHGGRLWADSEYGKGSKFYFSLPVGL